MHCDDNDQASARPALAYIEKEDSKKLKQEQAKTSKNETKNFVTGTKRSSWNGRCSTSLAHQYADFGGLYVLQASGYSMPFSVIAELTADSGCSQGTPRVFFLLSLLFDEAIYLAIGVLNLSIVLPQRMEKADSSRRSSMNQLNSLPVHSCKGC
ncbi:unnamed protein product [Fraxinus pennsylvanica]|uniref:Uncharacterized protein n=1 Tax=Fraxinus pennsylvanica TaxID=56036 RepID=A0AAD1Z1G8_9LAMI|nr:unnamed protein product [Fraxinus pennsylvanica]